MNTLILHIDKETDPELEAAAAILRNGGTVIFPTETVYGLGANALSADAAQKIYEAKGRPSDNPLIVHIARWDQIHEIAAEVPACAERLAACFWPGPLTLILKKRAVVPNQVTGGLDTVAVRLPAHPIARRLIALAGVPVAAPSANLSGKPSPTRSAHVVQDMDGRVDCIICGGDAIGGVESTVLDLTVMPPMILRPGGISLEQLEAEVPGVGVDPALETAHNRAPRAPGMKYAHYAPDAPMTVFEGDERACAAALETAVHEALAAGRRVAVLAFEDYREAYTEAGAIFFSLGSKSRPEEAANRLFQSLRACNDACVDQILAQAVSEKGIGLAVMNRMRKAAGGNVVRV